MNKKHVIAVVNQKGGAGKTTCAMLLIDRALETLGTNGVRHPIYAHDTESGAGGLKRFFMPTEITCINLDDSRTIMPVMDRIMENDTNVTGIFDFGARTNANLIEYIRHGGLADLAETGEIIVTLAHVLGVGQESLNHLTEMASAFPDVVRHVAVKNLHGGANFETFERAPARQAFLRLPNAFEVTMTALDPNTMELINVRNVSFSKFGRGVDRTNNKEPGEITARAFVRHWRKANNAAMDAILNTDGIVRTS